MQTRVVGSGQKKRPFVLNTVAIKTILLIQGVTISDLARRSGYRRDYLSLVIWNHRRSRRAQDRIAGALGSHLADLVDESAEPAC